MHNYDKMFRGGNDIKRFTAACAIALVLFLILTFIGNFFVPNPLHHMYLNPDSTVNTDFLDPEDWNNHQWYASTYTTYASGTVSEKTTMRRGLEDCNFLYTRLGEDFRWEIITGGNVAQDIAPNETVIHRDCFRHSLLTWNDDEFYTYTTRTLDENAKWSKIEVTTLGAMGTEEDVLVHTLSFQYNDDGTLNRQTQTLPDGTVFYRLYTYTNGKLTGHEDYDGSDALLSYAVYSYDGNTETRNYYSASGEPTGTTALRTDLFGRPQTRKTFDTEGNLTSKLTYNYLIFQYFLSPYGICYFIIILCFSIFIGYEFTLKMKKTKEKK